MPERTLAIAFFAQDFPPSVGGTHVYNQELARRLHERGHRVRVFTWSTGKPGVAESDAAQPFPVHRQPFARPGRGIAVAGVAEFVERWRPDLAFVSGGSGALSGVVRAAASRLPTVVSVHDLRDKGRRRGPLGRWRVRWRYGFDRAARLTANSDHTRRRLLELGVAAAKVDLVYPGVDTKKFRPDRGAGELARKDLGLEGAQVLLTVSRLAPNKGHLRVLEVLPVLRRRFPRLVYLIVGDGGMRGTLERRTAELGLAGAVVFTGRVPDVRPHYHACDVFVMASTPHGAGGKAGEGFGMAYVEAGACGKPAVASASGGGGEIVVDGETGCVVDPEDAPALEAALASLLADPDRARALGERARERVLRFDWEHAVAALERALRAAAGRPGRREPEVEPEIEPERNGL
ncbi:MAG TPA: glycosyltransferase family 4 protein [Myxococcota bacterium]